MNSNLRTRLAKLEQRLKPMVKDIRSMTDEELAVEIDAAMQRSRYAVCHRLNHPNGVFEGSTGEYSEDDITLQMIAGSDAVDEVARQIAIVLISAGCRKSAAEKLQEQEQAHEN